MTLALTLAILGGDMVAGLGLEHAVLPQRVIQHPLCRVDQHLEGPLGPVERPMGLEGVEGTM